MSSHSLSLTAPTNFRDLAECVHPRLALRPRTLFRSDHLGALDEAQARAVRALGVRRVLDFRGAQERLSAACVVPDVTVHSLAIEPTIVQVLADLQVAGRRPTPQEVVGYMQDTYRGFVRNNTPRFAEFFSHLLASGEPTVFHCTAGKDRTGLAAALLLHALGATQDEILTDYLLTNQRLRAPSGLAMPAEIVAVLWGVQPSFLEAAFEVVRADHGGLDAYLERSLGVDAAGRKRLRALYLQD